MESSRVGPSLSRRRCRRWLLGLAALVVLPAAACSFSEPALAPITQETPVSVPIPALVHKTGIFDVMAADQVGHRLYLADGLERGVDVFDISAAPGRFLKTIPMDAIPNGIVFAPETGQLFVANDDGTVAAIDANPASRSAYRVQWQIPLKGQGVADLIGYDPADHKLYVTNPEDGFASTVSTVTDSLLGEIPNLGFTGQPTYNPVDGMVYLPDGDRNSLLKIRPSTDKVVAEYVLPVLCEPHGLAIDPATDQGLVGCQDRDKDHQVTLSWDFRGEKMLRTFDFAGAGDQVSFDAAAQHFYFAAQNYDPPEIAVFSANPLMFLTAVPTSAKSHGVAYDESHKLIYTYDGRHGEAAVWDFPDPVAGCTGNEAARAAAGAPKSTTPHCQPKGNEGAGPALGSSRGAS
jgi:DNA-binding beta-propeller fold protein YncE